MNTFVKILLVVLFTVGMAFLFVYSISIGFSKIFSSLPTVPPLTFPTITLPSVDVPTSPPTSKS